MDHGTNKAGPARDDMMKKELQGELKADRALRAEEDHELEPSGEDQRGEPDRRWHRAGQRAGRHDPGGRGNPYRNGPASAPESVSGRPRHHRQHAAGEQRPGPAGRLAQRLPENERYENAQRIVESLGLSR